MESKICTYTAKSVRLQMVFVKDDNDQCWIDIRFNRRTILRFNDYQAIDAAHRFSHIVSRLCIDRDTSCLSNLTLQYT